MKIKLNDDMKEIVEFFNDLGKCYFVGGCVRDLVYEHKPKDYDLITAKTPDETETYIKSKGKKVYKVGKRFGTLGVKLSCGIIEITTYRKDIYDFKSRKPVVEFSKNLTEDLSRRDFTINALVCDFNGNVKDYFGGLEDKENCILKTVGNPKTRFKEDPLRILRALRFASKYDFLIDEKTEEKLQHCRFELLRLSKERIIEEINKAFELDADNLYNYLFDMWEYKIFQVIIPELQLQYNFLQENPNHKFLLDTHTKWTVYEVRKATNDKRKLWTALLHDIAKPFTKTLHKSEMYYNYIDHHTLGAAMTDRLLKDYKFSNDNRKFIVESIQNHINDDCWLREFDNKAKQ